MQISFCPASVKAGEICFQTQYKTIETIFQLSSGNSTLCFYSCLAQHAALFLVIVVVALTLYVQNVSPAIKSILGQILDWKILSDTLDSPLLPSRHTMPLNSVLPFYHISPGQQSRWWSTCPYISATFHLSASRTPACSHWLPTDTSRCLYS